MRTCQQEPLLNPSSDRYGDNAPMARISYLEEAVLPEPEEVLAALEAELEGKLVITSKED